MKIQFLIAFAFLLFFPIPSQVFGCECFGDRDYTEIFDKSEIVFIGTVNDIIANKENQKTSVTFDVHSIAKGELTERQVTTNTPLSDCSVDYKIDVTYVVVINEKEFFSTDRCTTKSLEIMDYYEVIPEPLLLAMGEHEVSNNMKNCTDDKHAKDNICDDEDRLIGIPPPENSTKSQASNGLSKLIKAVSQDIPIGDYQINDVVQGGGLADGQLHIEVNPGITDPVEQEEIFQELVILLEFDSFEINFAEPTQQVKALCESADVILVDGVCQKKIIQKQSVPQHHPNEGPLSVGGQEIAKNSDETLYLILVAAIGIGFAAVVFLLKSKRRKK